MMNQLRANGRDVVHESTDEDFGVVIINTCGFIEQAKEESIEAILQFAEAKKEGQIDRLYVTGCLSERYRSDLQKEIPAVDAYFGTGELPRLLKTLGADYKHELVGERLLSTPSHYAYLKVSEGCNKKCAFCAIPLMRGKHQSKSIGLILEEARKLARNGTRELMLIAQDMSYYGKDLYGRRKLPELLDRLARVEGIDWIRLHYVYPSQFPLETLNVMREHDSICNYIDMPLQHISDRMLKAMRRGITSRRTYELIDTIRQKVPDIALRTTLMVGFPGETEEDFEQLCDFVRKVEFDRLGVFTYSHEENTAAYQQEDNVPEAVKKERANRIMEIQRDISLRKNQKMVGQTLNTMVDRAESGHFVGRTEYDSKEVDNEVWIRANGQYPRLGDFTRIKVTEATEYDLYGEIVD
jgi:ribosomal protein S12 methylthiotransferase